MQIGLIAEGASELRILKHILARYLGTEHDLNEIQPKTDNHGKQIDAGGWHRVITTFENKNTIQEALIYNDYVLVQIDTDNAQTAPFSVNIIGEDGKCCDDDVLHDNVKNRILNSIPNIQEEHKQRIILAICIHETECWLLPIYYNNHHKCKTTNCINLLNTKLNQNKIHPITDKNSPTANNSYNDVLRNLKKPKDIKDCAEHNIGFKLFIEQLDDIKATLEQAGEVVTDN